jgi:sterol desaturase/sphingolipid hydroxylase (fatty acid hydroxylase superfamily)
MPPFEDWLRANIEPATYVIFFGLLTLLAGLEYFIEMRHAPQPRRRRWPANFLLTALNIVILGVLPVTALAAADIARDNGWGLFNQLAIPALLLLPAGILIRSLASWLIHFAFHNVPLLWRLHRVHHTDTHLDVSTTVRFHPLEFIVTTPVILLTVIVFGLSPVSVMIYELLDAAIAVFCHANIRLPHRLNRLLEKVIITPDIHRIHHSTQVPETNSNYGATLTLWDWMFGTLQRKPQPQLADQPLGLDEVGASQAASLWHMMTLPFRPYKLGAIDSGTASHAETTRRSPLS